MTNLTVAGLILSISLFAGTTQRHSIMPMPSQTSIGTSIENDVFPERDVLYEELVKARRSGDKETYEKLRRLFISKRTQETLEAPEPRAIGADPSLMWNGDKLVYEGNVNYNSWAISSGYDEEEVSIDYYAGDTLRVAVACSDSTIRVFRSDDLGMTWYWETGVTGSGNWFEPEIINFADGSFYVFGRSDYSDGSVGVMQFYPDGSWHWVWIATSDTILNYTVCTDRAEYPGEPYFYLLYQAEKGGQGQDEIYFTVSIDAGSTWATPTTLQYNGSQLPDLVYGDNDYLFETYRAFNSNDSIYIKFRYSDDLGSSWNPSIILAGDTLMKMGPQVAAQHDGSGEVWVVYARKWFYSPYDYDLFYTTSTDYGTTWDSPHFLSGYAYKNEILPSISIFDDTTWSSIYVSYITADTLWGNTKLYTTSWETDGDTWAEADTFADYSPELIRPAQGWENPGAPALAYVGEGAHNVYYDSWSNTDVEENPRPEPEAAAVEASPNPFSGNVRIRFLLPTDGKVSVRIYNAAGEAIASLHEGDLNAGYHTFNWNGRSRWGKPVPHGIYFLYVESEALRFSRKLIKE